MAERKFVFRDGARLTPWMAYIIAMLDIQLYARWKVHVVVMSAIRLYLEQVAIFLKRYVRAADVNGRRVYDTRVWKGVRYYRIDKTGTVAPPGTSNHEIQNGDTAAFDLRDTGADAGITVKNSERGRWFREEFMPKYGMDPEGDSFGEGWHSRVRNIWKTPPAPAADNEEDDDMMLINIAGKRGERRGGVYLVEKGKATFIGPRRVEAPGGIPMFTDEGEIKRLQSKISGLR